MADIVSHSAMKPRQNATLVAILWLAVANALIPLSMWLFATGFFPYKPVLPGLANYGDPSEHGDIPAPPFDRLIFMVVDALRRYFMRLWSNEERD